MEIKNKFTDILKVFHMKFLKLRKFRIIKYIFLNKNAPELLQEQL